MSLLKPGDFLNQLKRSDAIGYSIPTPSPEYLAIHHEQVKELGLLEKNVEVELDQHLSTLLSLISNVLPEPTRSEIAQRITIGCVINPEMNAFIVRSEDGQFFAILFNRAMLAMLGHCAKLIAAAHEPSAVLFCDGQATEKLKQADYIGMGNKWLARYANTGEPVGPNLIIDHKTEAATFATRALTAMQFFLIGHELAHYINGDLNPANFVKAKWTAGPDVELFNQNISHIMEFKADKVGFELFLRYLFAQQPEFPACRAFELSAGLFFTFLSQISNCGSETHPKPSDRQLAIVHEFFGEAAAQIVEKGLDNSRQVEVFRAMVGKQSVEEVLKRRISKP